MGNDRAMKKGKSRIQLARETGSSNNELPFDCLNFTSVMMEVNEKVTALNIAGKRSAPLISMPLFLKMPLAGFEPASSAESKGSFHPLSYRGIISNKSSELIYGHSIFDDKTNVKDNNIVPAERSFAAKLNGSIIEVFINGAVICYSNCCKLLHQLNASVKI